VAKTFIDTFNLRVYGLWVNTQQEVLLVEEKIKANTYVKFPGGGLEFGEGILDCLYREIKEETALDVLAHQHYYTTEFFQPSKFHPRHQVISIYYRIRCDEQLPIQKPANDPVIQRYIWHPIAEAFPVSLPIDVVVARNLQQDLTRGLFATLLPITTER
jgi:ADP-ribose pyrophosphatase YjhB (NUDIX family)